MEWQQNQLAVPRGWITQYASLMCIILYAHYNHYACRSQSKLLSSFVESRGGPGPRIVDSSRAETMPNVHVPRRPLRGSPHVTDNDAHDPGGETNDADYTDITDFDTFNDTPSPTNLPPPQILQQYVYQLTGLDARDHSFATVFNNG